MVALRSLEAEVMFAEQEVDRFIRRGIRNRWEREALRRAEDKLRQAQQLLAKAVGR